MVSFTSLYSGSNKNSSLICIGSKKILVDCGGSFRSLTQQLKLTNTDISEISAVFITHSHTDHIDALKTLVKKTEAKIYSSIGTHTEICRRGIDMPKERRIIIEPDMTYDFKDYILEPFRTPHDTSEPMGYNFCADDKKITVATDIGYIYDEFIYKIKAVDLLFFESNHDVEMLKNSNRPRSVINRILGKGGHLSNETSAEFTLKLAENGLKRLMLGHLSGEANTPELAYQTTSQLFESNNIIPGKDIELYVAERNILSKTVII